MGRFFEKLKSAKNERVKWKDCSTKKDKFKFFAAYALSALFTLSVLIVIFALLASVVFGFRSCSLKASASTSDEPSYTYSEVSSLYYNSGTYISRISTQNSYVRPMKFRFSLNLNSFVDKSGFQLGGYYNGLSYNTYQYILFNLLDKSHYVHNGLNFNGSCYMTSFTWTSFTGNSSDNLYGIFVFENVGSFLRINTSPSGNSTVINDISFNPSSVLSLSLFRYEYLTNAAIGLWNDCFQSFQTYTNTMITPSIFSMSSSASGWAHLIFTFVNNAPNQGAFSYFHAFIPISFDVQLIPGYDGWLDYEINPVQMAFNIDPSTGGNDLFDYAFEQGYQRGLEDGGSELANIQADSIYMSGVSAGYAARGSENEAVVLERLTPWKAMVNGVNQFFNIEVFPGFPIYLLVLISFGCILLGILFKVFFHS